MGTYAGCDGMKTGFTNKSRYSLVATANRGGTHLMAVVLGAENKDVRAAVATQLLNRGFEMTKNNSAPIERTTPVAPIALQSSHVAPVATAPTFAAAYNAATTAAAPTYNAPSVSRGGAGVQFGAFSSRDAAAKQVANVKNKLGVVATIEQASNGMFRVRANGITDAAATELRNRATNAGIDSYVFH